MLIHRSKLNSTALRQFPLGGERGTVRVKCLERGTVRVKCLERGTARVKCLERFTVRVKCLAQQHNTTLNPKSFVLTIRLKRIPPGKCKETNPTAGSFKYFKKVRKRKVNKGRSAINQNASSTLSLTRFRLSERNAMFLL